MTRPTCFVVDEHPRTAPLRMIERIYDLYDALERQRILLSFKGDLSSELVTALLGLVERKMEVIEPDAKARKRVFNVVMECLQNLYHHNQRPASQALVAPSTAEPHGVVMIAQLVDGYSILTGNFMAGNDVKRVKDHLDRINAMTPEELRAFYRTTLNNGLFSQQGGGGLGMIEIARKSGGKLEYGFVPFNEDSAFFSLNVNVTT